MGDFVIKPDTGAGNSLILQDQAGGAVLTTSDTGATIADGIALGTPASGVLTNATFPAGCIIQVQSKRNTLLDSGTETSWTNTGITMEITPKLASSYIHFMGVMYVSITNNSGYGGCSFRWKRAQSGQGDVYPEELDDTNGTGTNDSYSSHWNQWGGGHPIEFGWRHPFNGIDKTTHTAGSQITYTLERRCFSVDGLVVGAGTNPGVGSNFICNEIVV